MLDVPDLKLIVTEKLQSQLEDHWVAVSFPELVKEAYSVTNARDKEIRDIMVNYALKHIDELRKLEAFKEVLSEIGEFSGGLVMSPLSNLSVCPSTLDSKYYCCNCKQYCATYCKGCGIWKWGM